MSPTAAATIATIATTTMTLCNHIVTSPHPIPKRSPEAAAQSAASLAPPEAGTANPCGKDKSRGRAENPAKYYEIVTASGSNTYI
jgi:hypothetical protein